MMYLLHHLRFQVCTYSMIQMLGASVLLVKVLVMHLSVLENVRGYKEVVLLVQFRGSNEERRVRDQPLVAHLQKHPYGMIRRWKHSSSVFERHDTDDHDVGQLYDGGKETMQAIMQGLLRAPQILRLPPQKLRRYVFSCRPTWK